MPQGAMAVAGTALWLSSAQKQPPAWTPGSPTQRRRKAKEPMSYEPSPMAKRETLELVRAYYKISDPQVRKQLCAMTKALGAAASGDD